MDEQRNDLPRRVNPRRRKRSKMQIFKEAYLPLLIVAVAAVLILVFMIGSITRAVQKSKYDKHMAILASESLAQEQEELSAQAQDIIKKADILAAGVDYDGALALLDTFAGDEVDYPEIALKRDSYTLAKSQLVAWEDPSEVVNLSFQLLIADTSRAYSNPTYGFSFNRNFVTTGEFSTILKQLYENGYILVSLDDFMTEVTQEDGTTVMQAKPIYLPNGKKPLVLTQTNVNYNTYLIDSDGDKLPDKNGGGFASKLILDENGNFACEMVSASGEVVTGDFDLVPILEKFIQSHPDFSYRGARAVLALTGYNGLFGYRTNADAKTDFGEAAYQAALENAVTMIDSLRAAGYELACYTYENIPYGTSGTAEIKADLENWKNEVLPLLGEVDTLVYAQMSDISGSEPYSGEKYELLKNAGFKKFLGFCEDGKPWATVDGQYIRQGRLIVSGSSMAHNGEYFNGIFDSAMTLDRTRGEVPE